MKFYLVVWALLLFVAGCGPKPEPTLQGLILPHHLLVEHEIRDFLEEVVSRRDPVTVERIILLSPNHFGYGTHGIQSTTEPWGPPSKILNLDTETIQWLADSSPLAIEPADFPKEHGITVPATLLKEKFPDAILVPITLKPDTLQRDLDRFVAALKTLEFQNTLVVASVDFTHYVSEQVALANDQRTLFTLEKMEQTFAKEGDENLLETLKILAQSDLEPEGEATNPGAVAFDSPESLYVLIRLMENSDPLDFNVWKRTSSASLTGIKNPAENTSHVFGWFQTSEN